MIQCLTCDDIFEKYLLIRNKEGFLVPACPKCKVTVVEGRFNLEVQKDEVLRNTGG